MSDVDLPASPDPGSNKDTRERWGRQILGAVTTMNKGIIETNAELKSLKTWTKWALGIGTALLLVRASRNRGHWSFCG